MCEYYYENKTCILQSQNSKDKASYYIILFPFLKTSEFEKQVSQINSQPLITTYNRLRDKSNNGLSMILVKKKSNDKSPSFLFRVK